MKQHVTNEWMDEMMKQPGHIVTEPDLKRAATLSYEMSTMIEQALPAHFHPDAKTPNAKTWLDQINHCNVNSASDIHIQANFKKPVYALTKALDQEQLHLKELLGEKFTQAVTDIFNEMRPDLKLREGYAEANLKFQKLSDVITHIDSLSEVERSKLADNYCKDTGQAFSSMDATRLKSTIDMLDKLDHVIVTSRALSEEFQALQPHTLRG